MGSFSLISVGAGSCPNSAKQPPTLQNKCREAYGYCQGNRWIFIWFVKELETACCILIRRLFQATGIVWKQGEVQHGRQRQQKQAWVRLGFKGERKPDTKLCRAWETRRKSSTKYVKGVEGKLSNFESKGLCGGFCRGWRYLWGMEGTGWSTSGCSGHRAVPFSVREAAPWLLLRFAPFSLLPGTWLQEKAVRMARLALGTALSGGRGSWGHTQEQQPNAPWASCRSHLWRSVD